MIFRDRARPKGLASALLSKLARRPAVKTRRLVPFMDGLESRIAPAVAGNLYVAGTTLVYNGNFADNNVTVSGTDTAFELTDTAGTINSTVPGMSATALSVGSAVIPSYIQTIAIQGQNGTDVVNVGALTTSRNLILAGTTVNITGALVADNVTATGTLVSLTGDSSITTDGAPAIAGSVTINGTLNNSSSYSTSVATPTINTTSVIDGNITLNGLVVGNENLVLDAGTGGNVTVTGAINLGGAAGFAISGTASESAIGANTVNLHQIVDGTAGTLVNAAGAVNLNGSLVSTGPVVFAANLDDTGPQGFDQVSGSITTTAATGGFSAGGLGSAVDIFVNAYPDPTGAVVGTGTGGATLTGITTGSGGNVLIATGNSYANNGVIPLNGGGPIQGTPLYGGLNVSTGTGGLYAVSGAGGINLTTSVASLEVGDFSPAPSGGNVTITNSGQALTLVGVFTTAAVEATNGNISISNNLDLTVGTGTSPTTVVAGGSGHSVTLTTTNPDSTDGELILSAEATVGNAADTVNFDTTGAVDFPPSAVVTGSTLNIVAGSGSSNIDGSVGTSADPLYVTSGTTSPITVNVSTTVATNGINISSPSAAGSPITVTGATAQTGVINLTTVGANDLVVNGNVANDDASAITLSSGQNIILNSGSITSGSGLITLTPGTLTTGTAGNVTIAAGTKVATGGAITVASSVAVEAGAVDNIDISGTLASGAGAVTIDGVTGDVPVTLGISGTVASNTAIVIDTDKGTGSQILNIGGSLVSAGTTDIWPGGDTGNGVILSTTGLINSGGTFTIDPTHNPGHSDQASQVMNLSGTIIAGGATGVKIYGTLSAGPVLLNNSGSISATSGNVFIEDVGATAPFLVTNTGSITGGNVTLEGATGATNTFSLGGSLTATTGLITVSTAGDSVASQVVISGVTTGTSATAVNGSGQADQFVVTPSLTTGFIFNFGPGANTLQINTALANISSSTANFTTPITFNNGYKTWTSLGGTVTVTPSVP